LPPGPVLCGADLEALSPAALQQQLRQVSVFARVLPQQKLRLV
jgi:magnesium-transporting ATPase (P-type)